MLVTNCTFAKAWKTLKKTIEEGKTGWGKVELKNLMFECLHNAALEQELEIHNEHGD